MKQEKKYSSTGFTLIEILVVIGMIAILAGIVLVAINPARQFAQGRDSQRTSNINAILNAIGQRMADNKGVFEGVNAASGKYCAPIPTATTSITTADATSTVSSSGDLGCLVPTYIATFPKDPSGPPSPETGYVFYQDFSTGRVHVLATKPEPSIPRTAPIEITR